MADKVKLALYLHIDLYSRIHGYNHVVCECPILEITTHQTLAMPYKELNTLHITLWQPCHKVDAVSKSSLSQGCDMVATMLQPT